MAPVTHAVQFISLADRIVVRLLGNFLLPQVVPEPLSRTANQVPKSGGLLLPSDRYGNRPWKVKTRRLYLVFQVPLDEQFGSLISSLLAMLKNPTGSFWEVVMLQLFSCRYPLCSMTGQWHIKNDDASSGGVGLGCDGGEDLSHVK